MKRWFSFHRAPRMHSLRQQIILLTLGFSMTLAVIAAGITAVVSQRYLVQSQRASAQNNLQMLASEIDADLQRAITFSNWIQIDPTISNYLSTVSAPDYTPTAARRQAMTTWARLNDEFNASELRSFLPRTVIAEVNGRTFLQVLSNAGTGTTGFYPHVVMETDYFSTLYEAPVLTWIGLADDPLRSHTAKGSSAQIIPMIRPIYSSSSSQVLGWMYMELSPKIILQRFQNVTLPEDSSLFVTIGDGYSYLYKDGALIPSFIPEEALTANLHEAGWSVSMVPSAAELRPRTLYYYGIAALIFTAILIAGIGLFFLLRSKITKPVTLLLDRIQKTGSGDFSRDAAIEWNNELGDIGRGINDLSENVQALMDKKVQDEKTKQELEYRILQSQINPHFMYNTLNTIKWMATIQGADGIADMSTALSRLLKNIAKGQNTVISLRHEIQLVDDYFTIMKYRYGGTIELSYQIDDKSLLDCAINRFSLQPIVENAIFHGIEPKGSAGKITVHIARIENSDDKDKAEPDRFYIEITDNGVGMSPEAIQKILSADDSSANEFFRQVGVANVNQRIHFTFGDRYGLSITSEVGSYTTMRFTLPVQTVNN